MALSERAHLVQGARRHHGVEAGVDATQQRVAIGHEKDFCGKRRIDARRHVRFVPLQNRSPGRQNHFKRAGDAGAITGHQPRRGGRIAPRQFGMQCLDAVACEPSSHLIADLRRDRRHRGKPSRERTEIEPGAADDDGRTRFALVAASTSAASVHQRPTEKFSAASTWP